MFQNEVSDLLLLLDSQLGGAGCALCIPFISCFIHPSPPAIIIEEALQ